jgi:hypothetical protein
MGIAGAAPILVLGFGYTFVCAIAEVATVSFRESGPFSYRADDKANSGP